MSTPGVPISGRKTVDQVDPTNSLTFHAEQSGLSVVAALLSTHTVVRRSRLRTVRTWGSSTRLMS